MEVHEIISTVAGSSVPIGGGLISWYVKKTISKTLDNIDKLFDDWKALSTKLNKTRDDLETEICSLEKEIAAMNERLKFLEKK